MSRLVLFKPHTLNCVTLATAYLLCSPVLTGRCSVQTTKGTSCGCDLTAGKLDEF